MHDPLKEHAARAARRLAGLRTVFPPCNIPNDSRGDWTVDRFIVDSKMAGLQLIRSVVKNSRGYTPPGEYVRLLRDGAVIMSDTLDELADHEHFVATARGRVLVSGLGLGLVCSALAAKPEVDSVTVVERDADVIALVSPHIPLDRIEIVHADVNEWKAPKGAAWDCAWHDIWDDICDANVDEMRGIRDRYAKRVPRQAFWGGVDLYFQGHARSRFLVKETPPSALRRRA
jgi:hypothetical protein